ncbi:MAG: 50S ribosomal protein L15 [Candidatus Komeilibacteria bacterium CG_4_10_14_0_2_um_filter_37_10]|uniref:Large ribosomal subunit protein uL15 n=1 Tax=Candidatus Komeilibacteria bacterium CG_4_10_14_0_2_um_filter_37_10 TaxID=1974470 RepID=A0A2M7VG06_9BACT|nr:MAG: 50S ribosomal protein L15 [Candidatus Komeilibacteria bacterium CG_4_10_14_0_2_um_filter_37_10]
MELLGLHNLTADHKAKKKKLRVGRGNASGGNYSGRGMKGQKARSGGSHRLQMKGLHQMLLRLPKQRGFKAINSKFTTINLDILNKLFQEGELVCLRTLTKKGLIEKGEKRVKILANGTLQKKLVVKLDDLSVAATKAILAAGGQIEKTVKSNEEVKEI